MAGPSLLMTARLREGRDGSRCELQGVASDPRLLTLTLHHVTVALLRARKLGPLCPGSRPQHWNTWTEKLPVQVRPRGHP